MNRLPLETRAQILGLLVEGSSLRAASRLTGVSINTVTKLLVDIGKACADYQDRALRNLPCKRLQVDEVWAFVYAKAKNVPANKEGSAGDVWTWTAIDADTKLIAAWLIGDRGWETGRIFIADLASRLANRVQLTSDGHRVYMNAVYEAFGHEIDYAMLQKIYRANPGGEGRYSPGECVGAEKKPKLGNPAREHISTSYVERQNLTMRMSMRRFTRLTNAFSKKVENHAHAVALHFMWYNFGRTHKTLGSTPAMAAGVADKKWSHVDIVLMADEFEAARQWEAKQTELGKKVDSN